MEISVHWQTRVLSSSCLTCVASESMQDGWISSASCKLPKDWLALMLALQLAADDALLVLLMSSAEYSSFLFTGAVSAYVRGVCVAE